MQTMTAERRQDEEAHSTKSAPLAFLSLYIGTYLIVRPSSIESPFHRSLRCTLFNDSG
jgi:hypothetical protein